MDYKDSKSVKSLNQWLFMSTRDKTYTFYHYTTNCMNYMFKLQSQIINLQS